MAMAAHNPIAAPDRSTGPVFVVGSYRSGTSIFGWCLGQHPNLVNLPETNWLARLTVDLDNLYRLATVNGDYSHLGQIGTSRDEFYRLMGEGLQHLMAPTNAKLVEQTELHPRDGVHTRGSTRDPKRRWVDATPENSHYVYGLAKLFPGARFIHLLRDPDDVARSLMKFSRTGAQDYEHDDAYRNWTRLTRAAFMAERALGTQRMLRVRYADLTATPEAVLRGVLTFLGEEYSAACLKPLAHSMNSSKVVPGEVPLDTSTEAACEAGQLYREVLEAPGPEVQGEAAAYAAIEQAFLQYCRDMQQRAP